MSTAKPEFTIRSHRPRVPASPDHPRLVHHRPHAVLDEGGVFDAHPRAVLGPVPVLWIERRAAVEAVVTAVVARRRLFLSFCNAHTMRIAHRDRAYAADLRRLIVLNDGLGMNIAARFAFGRSFPDNLNGTDFVPALFRAVPAGTRIHLLGARPDVVARAAEVLTHTHPTLSVVGARDGYFSAEETEAVLAETVASRPDILLVAMGNPRQERFMVEHAEKIGATVVIAVGALFDFIAERFPRAPRLVRKVGLEWAWRFAHEPRRLFERYTVGNVDFLLRTARYCMTNTPESAEPTQQGHPSPRRARDRRHPPRRHDG